MLALRAALLLMAALQPALLAAAEEDAPRVSALQLRSGDSFQSAATSEARRLWWWASKPGPDQNFRPSNRPQVYCSWWCKSGYTRRDVTIGPKCKWWHIGKCADDTVYKGEGCDFVSATCSGTLECQDATPAEQKGQASAHVCKEPSR